MSSETTQAETSQGQTKFKAPPLLTLILCAASSVITLNLFMPALPDIALALNVSQSTMSWAFTGYLIATAVLQLFLGPISDRLGRRVVMRSCIIVFILASLAAALAPNAVVFFIARFAQAAIVAGMVLTLAIVRDTATDQEAAASRLATVSMVMAIGPLLAPLVGGALSDVFGWRSNFVFLALYGALILVIVWRTLGETNSFAGRHWQEQVGDYWALIRDPRFWAYALCYAFTAGMFYLFVVGMPIIGREELGLSNTNVGLLMAALPLGYIAGNNFVRLKSDSWGIAKLIVWGRAFGVISPLICLALYYMGVNPIISLIPLILVGTSNAFTVPTCHAGAMSVNRKVAGSAAGLVASLALFIGAFTTIFGARLMAAMPTMDVMLWLIFVVAIVGIPSTISVWRNRDA